MASRVNKPDQAPDPDGGNDLASSFEVMIERTAALEEAILQQTSMLRAQIDVTNRMQLVGGGRQEAISHVAGAMAQFQPRMRKEVLHGLASTGGVPHDMTMGITKITPTGALTSLQSLRAYGAQRLGTMIAGRDLYESQAQEPGAPASAQARPDSGFDVTPQPVLPAARPRARRPAAQKPMGARIASGAAAAPGEAAQAVGSQTAAVIAAATEAAVKGAVEAEEAAPPGRQAPGIAAATWGGTSVPAPGVPVTAAPSAVQPEVVAPVPEAGTGQPVQGPPGRMVPPPPTSQMPPPSGTGGGAGPGVPGGSGPGVPGSGAGAPAGAPPPAAGGASASWMNAMRQNLGARVAMSGGTPGGILGMLRKVPILGLGIDLLNAGANFYTGQREAGRVYQETEGGSNLSAQTERAHAFAYEASMFGRVPNGVAAQMFGAVTSMGFNQAAVNQGPQLQNRQSALNFMYHQYTATGTTVDQSAQILETASQNATVSLKSVSDAMTTLSDVAGKAGTNAANARNNFNELLNTALQAGAGAGAPQLAGGQATTQASYGNAFAKTNFGGISGAGNQYMLSGQSGLSPAQIQQTMRTNPAAYNTLAGAADVQFIGQLPGMSPEMLADLKSMVSAVGGTATIKQQPALVAQVAGQFLDKYQVPANIDLNVWASVLSQLTSVPLTPNNVMAYIVENIGGNTLGSNAAAGGTGPGSSVSAGAAAAGTSSSAKTGGTAAGARTGQYGLAKAIGGTGVVGQLVHALKHSLPYGLGNFIPGGSTHKSQTWQQVLQGSKASSGAVSAYLDQEKKTGQRNPVLEALIQNVPAGTQVAVQTASGTRVVSFEDAIKQFPNEMEAGNVQFYGSAGQNLGTTGTITQGLTDPKANTSSETGSKTTSGVSLSQFQKSNPNAGSGAVNQTIGLSDEAKQLLKLLPSNSDAAAAAGTAPSNPLPASSSR